MLGARRIAACVISSLPVLPPSFPSLCLLSAPDLAKDADAGAPQAAGVQELGVVGGQGHLHSTRGTGMVPFS